MKKIIAVMALFLSITMLTNSAFAKVIVPDPDHFVFGWDQNKENGVTVVSTPSNMTADIQTTATVPDLFTSYHIEYTISDGLLNISGQSISPSGTTYNAGPINVLDNGTIALFQVYLNSTAQAGSFGGIYNLMVNNVTLSQTITADSDHTYASFVYLAQKPVTQISFDYFRSSESPLEIGFGLTVINTVVVPEPATVSLLAMSAIFSVAFLRKKKA